MKGNISKQIKKLRYSHKLNQSQMSKILGISQAALSAYENGNIIPSLEVLLNISNYFNVSLDWLCGLENRPHFYSVADIIRTIFAINDIDSLELNIETAKDVMNDSIKYTCTSSVSGIFKSENSCSEENDTAALLCQFIHDWKTTVDQLKNISDEEMKQNYYTMWLEKQLKHYNSIPVKTKEVSSKEIRFSK